MELFHHDLLYLFVLLVMSPVAKPARNKHHAHQERDHTHQHPNEGFDDEDQVEGGHRFSTNLHSKRQAVKQHLGAYRLFQELVSAGSNAVLLLFGLTA